LDAGPAPLSGIVAKLRPIPACRPGPNLPEERNKGRRRAELDPLFGDLRDLISAAGADVAEKARREGLLRHLESADKAHPLELAKYSLERSGASSSEMDIKQSHWGLPI